MEGAADPFVRQKMGRGWEALLPLVHKTARMSDLPRLFRSLDDLNERFRDSHIVYLWTQFLHVHGVDLTSASDRTANVASSLLNTELTYYDRRLYIGTDGLIDARNYVHGCGAIPDVKIPVGEFLKQAWKHSTKERELVLELNLADCGMTTQDLILLAESLLSDPMLFPNLHILHLNSNDIRPGPPDNPTAGAAATAAVVSSPSDPEPASATVVSDSAFTAKSVGTHARVPPAPRLLTAEDAIVALAARRIFVDISLNPVAAPMSPLFAAAASAPPPAHFTRNLIWIPRGFVQGSGWRECLPRWRESDVAAAAAVHEQFHGGKCSVVICEESLSSWVRPPLCVLMHGFCNRRHARRAFADSYRVTYREDGTDSFSVGVASDGRVVCVSCTQDLVVRDCPTVSVVEICVWSAD